MASANLENIIQHAKSKIPEQGPLEFFVHHNTVHHYENTDFFVAVKNAAQDYNCQAFMPEDYYRHKYAKRRIEKSDLSQAIKNFKNEYKLELHEDIIFRLLVDDYNHSNQHADEIAQIQREFYSSKPLFYEEKIKRDYSINISYYIQPVIYKFFSSYFDAGCAYWPLPNRKEGMLSCFFSLYKKACFFDNKFRKELSKLIGQYHQQSAIEIIESVTEHLKIPTMVQQEYLLEICLKHKGWSGYILSLEGRPEWIKGEGITPDFNQALAIMLLCECAAIHIFYRNPEFEHGLIKIPKHNENFLKRFYAERQKHQEKGLFNEALPHLDDFNRQEIMHRAYENSFDDKFLNAYANTRVVKCNQSDEVSYQLITCIDEREESFRRYLEADSNCETFSCAGHFGLNISYKGFFDKHYRALCPAIVKPEYKITESIIIHRKWLYSLIQIAGEIQWFAELSPKTIISGALACFIRTTAQVIPFACDIIDPGIMYNIKKKMHRFKMSAASTRLVYKQEQAKLFGIPFDERVTIARNFITTLGLKKSFSKYIFIVGHGSESLNNPHEAAHDCGACGGGRGGPNARLMASLLNEADIRKKLYSQYKIEIPAETIFLGAYHNTCSDEVIFMDSSVEEDKSLIQIKEKIRLAAQLDAQERCRRFAMVPIGRKPNFYERHVRARSMDIRQPRPEYGHATNAICIIGSRKSTRNLFLDRRAFLVSYLAEEDKKGELLNSLVNTAVPVCAGINLEYYFSFVDNEFYGCGTKLPHNVNGLSSVINGYMSDLQLGLPWQMVEIHQPVRLFVVIEASRKVIASLLAETSDFSRLVKNRWVKLAVCDQGATFVYVDGEFVPFHETRSTPKYFRVDERVMNSDGHLDFGEIASDE